jgi:hypothetical protein
MRQNGHNKYSARNDSSFSSFGLCLYLILKSMDKLKQSPCDSKPHETRHARHLALFAKGK